MRRNALSPMQKSLNGREPLFWTLGESTRPGAAEVSAEEELDRVLPVVRELRSCTDAVISVDTRHAAVAAAVLEAGADVINDISGLREAGMAELCAAARCGVVAMHMQGRPETMQDAPSYGDVVREVRGYFEERYDFLLGRGWNRSRSAGIPASALAKRRNTIWPCCPTWTSFRWHTARCCWAFPASACWAPSWGYGAGTRAAEHRRDDGVGAFARRADSPCP